MRKALVTGAGGFIGHHLVKDLVRRGHEVIAVDIKLPEFEESTASRFALQDLRNETAEWESLFRGVDDVYALAADMGGMGFISRNHADIMRNNTRIDLNTLEAARKAGVGRLLYTSSACVYPEHLQEAETAIPLTEAMAYPAKPQDGYGWEKLYAEQLCHYYRIEHGLDTRVVRFHNIYGPMGSWRGGREKAPAALCRKVAEARMRGEDRIQIWGDGIQTRSFCYIDDCIEGIERILESGYTEPLNLGRDEMVSINELAWLICDVAGIDLRLEHIDGPQGVRGRNSDNTRLAEVTGFTPSIGLRQGITATYGWIEAQVRSRI
jgi:nucleoside-diphosphate-sugar epimerase